ncbi:MULTISPECIES: cation:proton antiporter [unclassified Streptomyces]|uniref:cation:proton antiporter n=1 Tax=unclassified Streptomyces TaxID=2593676 RepID=UPI0011A54C43|nr:cation:proton antiporter [Streptomyces sp. BK340]TVZ78638.1 transporter (CPA2 family) [Streptomyces sp. BK340]
MSHPGTLILITAVAVLAPLLAYGSGRWIPVPLVVLEIVLGIAVGPDVLGWARHDRAIDVLSNLGLAVLIFLAGYEIDFAAVRGTVLNRSIAAWVISLAAGLGVAFALTGGETTKSFVIGTALTSTALGTVRPVLRDSGDLRGRFGTVVLAFGAAGELGPVIAMAPLLSGRGPAMATVVLVALAAVTAAGMWWALRPRPPRFSRPVARTPDGGSRFAVGYVVLLLASVLGLAGAFGPDILLGAFAAGVVTRLILHTAGPERSVRVLSRIGAMGFGFLVPLLFIVTGIDFDLDALLHGGGSLVLLPAFLLLFLLVRGLPLYLLAPPDLTRRDGAALLLHGSTCLPLVVAVTTVGLADRSIAPGEAAALVGAAMLSVPVFPLLALRIRAGRGERAGRPSGVVGSAQSW